MGEILQLIKFTTSNIHTGTPMVFIMDPTFFFYLVSLTCMHVKNVSLPVNLRTTSGTLHFRMNISLQTIRFLNYANISKILTQRIQSQPYPLPNFLVQTHLYPQQVTIFKAKHLLTLHTSTHKDNVLSTLKVSINATFTLFIQQI